MDISEIGMTALQVVSPMLVAALTWASTKLTGFIKARVNNEYLRGILVRLDDAVVTVVKDLQQTVINEVKAVSADGKITMADKKRIKDLAVANVKSYLGDNGRRVMSDVLGLSDSAVNGFISSKIESAVHDLRVTNRGIDTQSPAIKTSSVPLQ